MPVDQERRLVVPPTPRLRRLLFQEPHEESRPHQQQQMPQELGRDLGHR